MTGEEEEGVIDLTPIVNPLVDMLKEVAASVIAFHKKAILLQPDEEKLLEEIAGYVAANGLMTWTATGLAKYMYDQGWRRVELTQGQEKLIKEVQEMKR